VRVAQEMVLQNNEALTHNMQAAVARLRELIADAQSEFFENFLRVMQPYFSIVDVSGI